MTQMMSALATVTWALWFGGAVGLYLFVEQLFAVDRSAASRMVAPVFLFFGKYRLALAALTVAGISCRRVAEGSTRMKAPMFLLLAVLIVLVPLGILIVVGVERTGAVNERAMWMYMALSAIALLGLMLWRIPQGGDAAGLWAHITLALCALLAGLSVVAVGTNMEAARHHAMRMRIAPADSEFARLHAVSRALAGVEVVLLLVGGTLLTWRTGSRHARRDEQDLPVARIAPAEEQPARPADDQRDSGDDSRQQASAEGRQTGQSEPAESTSGQAEPGDMPAGRADSPSMEITMEPPEGFTEEPQQLEQPAEEQESSEQLAAATTADAPAEGPSDAPEPPPTPQKEAQTEPSAETSDRKDGPRESPAASEQQPDDRNRSV